jgi:hypothetical protein
MQMTKSSSTPMAINLNDLMEMDVVVYSETSIHNSNGDDSSSTTTTTKRKLGAVQEDGRITPLCVWTTEYAFQQSLEFLVDEEDLFPGFKSFRMASTTSSYSSSASSEEEANLENNSTTTAAAAGTTGSTQQQQPFVGVVGTTEIWIHSIVPQDALSYGSRQVGGGMGPGNPHGEESELLYYIDQLEIFW